MAWGIDPDVVQGGANAIVVTIVVAVIKNLKGFIRLSQTQWKKITSDHLVSIDNTIVDLKEESSKRRVDFDDLKKSVLTSLVKIENQVEQLSKIIPAIRGFVETVNKKFNELESLKTEVIELKKEVRMVRDKKD